MASVGRLAIVAIAALGFVSCGSESAVGDADVGYVVLATPTAIEEPRLNLDVFFGPGSATSADVGSSVAGATDERDTPDIGVAAGVDAPAPAASSSADATTAEPSLTVMPAALPGYGEHDLQFSGGGFPAGVDVIAVLCTIPGAPVEPSATLFDIADRLSDIEVVTDCDIDGAVLAATDARGQFVVDVIGDVQPNVVAFVGEIDGVAGAFATLSVSI